MNARILELRRLGVIRGLAPVGTLVSRITIDPDTLEYINFDCHLIVDRGKNELSGRVYYKVLPLGEDRNFWAAVYRAHSEELRHLPSVQIMGPKELGFIPRRDVHSFPRPALARQALYLLSKYSTNRIVIPPMFMDEYK